jgi:hypothetical protein
MIPAPRLRPSGLLGAGALALTLLFAATLALADGYERLLTSMASDPSHKVRMQAIRVLSKRLDRAGGAAPEALLMALTRAGAQDGSPLVRAFAIAALGKLRDERARSALEAARADADALVRAQAEQALGLLPAPPPPAGPRVLVVEAQPVEGLELPAELATLAEPTLIDRLTRRAPAGFTLDAAARSGPGYLLRVTILELGNSPTERGEQRVSLEVKLAIATWPEKRLRHILTARAAARTGAAPAARGGLHRKLLEAAVEQAVSDALPLLEGGS